MLVEHQAPPAGDISSGASRKGVNKALTKGLASQSSLSASRQLHSTLNSSRFRTPVIKLEHVLDKEGLLIGSRTHLFRKAEADMRPFSEAGTCRLGASENMTSEEGV